MCALWWNVDCKMKSRRSVGWLSWYEIYLWLEICLVILNFMVFWRLRPMNKWTAGQKKLIMFIGTNILRSINRMLTAVTRKILEWPALCKSCNLSPMTILLTEYVKLFVQLRFSYQFALKVWRICSQRRRQIIFPALLCCGVEATLYQTQKIKSQ